MKHNEKGQTHWAVVLPHLDRCILSQCIGIADDPVLFMLF